MRNIPIADIRHRLRARGRQAVTRLVADAWPLLHSAAAATLAWWIARHIAAHPQPFFAPIAAMVALNTSLGERGLNSLQLLLGVFVGIVTAEVALLVSSGGYAAMGIATFIAMAIAVMLGGVRIVIGQAGASAILTVALARGEAGTHRLEDALIGTAVALLFSQLLFAPEPLNLLRRAESAAFREMAAGVGLTADMLERDDTAPGEQAVSRLRELRDHLGDLARTRNASYRVARHSLTWRTGRAVLARETQNAGQLDLIGSSCVALSRTALGLSSQERRETAPCVRSLAGALAALAGRPGDRQARLDAIHGALEASRGLPHRDAPVDSAMGATAVAVRMVAGDIMAFAGVPPEQAGHICGEDSCDLPVPAPPAAPRTPFWISRRRT
jgi:uncharacterized membrane protein YgaE (UPF0421/DUF939 family)